MPGVPVLLPPELLAKPMRGRATDEVGALAGLLSRLELCPVGPATAEAATTLAASHRLRAADAEHPATAVMAGADRLTTNDRRDVPEAGSEIDTTYPDVLGDP